MNLANILFFQSINHFPNYYTVRYARHLKTNEYFAIKVIPISNIIKENMETQLKREIAIMKLVKHKNIVQMREVMKTQKNIYIVMELVTGGELFDKIGSYMASFLLNEIIVSNKKFSEDVARRYFQQLIDGIMLIHIDNMWIAVEYCHSKGVAHRDIKPENLLLDANDQLKVSDFGLSNLTKIGNTKQILKTSCGTPNYVAPGLTF